MAALTLLSTKGLSRNFGGLRAVTDVDFTLPEGEVRALIGPNGAGKTTFVSMLCGRITASSGSVSFLGHDITALPAHKRIAQGMAYTFQITSVFANLTCRENVSLAIQRRQPSDLASETDAALARVDLLEHADKTAGDMAYGHQRLLEVAMGLGQKPKLLILDEPTQGLTDAEIEGFNTLIRDAARDTTILLIEHNMAVVMALANQITVLDMGRIIAEGTPSEIHANAAVQAAYLGG